MCDFWQDPYCYLAFSSQLWSRQMLSIKTMVKNDPLILWPLSSCRKQLDLIVREHTYIYDQTTWQVFISPVIYQWSRKMSRTNPFVILRCGLLTWLTSCVSDQIERIQPWKMTNWAVPLWPFFRIFVSKPHLGVKTISYDFFYISNHIDHSFRCKLETFQKNRKIKSPTRIRTPDPYIQAK